MTEAEKVEAAMETLRDVIVLFTRHEGRSEEEAVHRSHMEAWNTVRAALRRDPEKVKAAWRSLKEIALCSDIPDDVLNMMISNIAAMLPPEEE